MAGKRSQLDVVIVGADATKFYDLQLSLLESTKCSQCVVARISNSGPGLIVLSKGPSEWTCADCCAGYIHESPLIRCAFLSFHAVVEGRTVPPHRLVGIRSHIECLQTAAQCMLLEVMSLQCKENSEGLKRSHERAM